MQEPKTFTCGICHRNHPAARRIRFGDTDLCPNCYEQETTTCDHCGERIWAEDAVSDSWRTLCMECYDNHYTRCTRCNSLIAYDDAYYPDGCDDEPYCRNCEPDTDRGESIYSYNHKPTPIFYGTGERYFGVELEVDNAGESSDNADTLLSIANETAEHIYCKRDGSLEDGFEIVTHPMTMQYHTHQMPWELLMENAVHLGYRSHQTDTCGLHIHVNRCSLGSDEAHQESAIARILFFVENYWNELLRFSRRTQGQMNQWAARYGRKDNPKEQIKHVKAQYSDRYRAVNLENYTTIEFRMFRGTLRYNTLIAALQLVNEICEAACSLSDRELEELTWSDFVARIESRGNPELVRYLKERRLFINDPTPGEEEL